MKTAIQTLGGKNTLIMTQKIAYDSGVPSSLHIERVCQACCNNIDLAPDFKGNLSAEGRIEKWVMKFLHGYEGRISRRISNMPGTVPDPAITTIISSYFSNFTQDQLNKVIYAHRLAMSAENILGLLLEEYLFTSLAPFGWTMAWGETIRSVDFCNAKGDLLQVKNRSNSENSSSSRVREGTAIQKWFRVNANTGTFEWDGLQQLLGIASIELNEENFRSFIQQVITKNPQALAIEPLSPWTNAKD